VLVATVIVQEHDSCDCMVGLKSGRLDTNEC